MALSKLHSKTYTGGLCLGDEFFHSSSSGVRSVLGLVFHGCFLAVVGSSSSLCESYKVLYFSL